MWRLMEAAVRSGAELTALGPSRLTWPTRYGAAVLLIMLATAVRLVIAPQEAGIPYVTYFPAATLAAVLGGLGCGLFATLLGAATAVYLFIPPFSEFKLSSEAVGSATVFLIDELIVCGAIEAMRHYYARYADTLAALEAAHAAEHEARLAAERANNAKSRFLAAASHDLRQPYQAMRLLLAALQSPRLAPDRTAAIIANMDAAMTAGEELLRSLLDVSTLEAGVVIPKPEVLDLAGIVTVAAARHRPIALSHKLDLRVRTRPGSVRADPVLLARVLDNLLSNAIRYTRSGGILVACRRRGGHGVIEVWDTGIGIAPEHQQAIFEEFFQVANPERDSNKGAGLGLAVVKKTANLMGARLTVASRQGVGTRFRLELPLVTDMAEVS